jgi:hypothetical protein
MRPTASERRARLSGGGGDNEGGGNDRGERPVHGRTYQISLASAHYRAQAGGFLDAHRSEKRDKLSATATLASVHACEPGAKPSKGCSGSWAVEALSPDMLDEVTLTISFFGSSAWQWPVFGSYPTHR